MTEKWLRPSRDAEGAGAPGELWKGRLQCALCGCVSPHHQQRESPHVDDPGEDLLYSSGPWTIVYPIFFLFWEKGGGEERKEVGEMEGRRQVEREEGETY